MYDADKMSEEPDDGVSSSAGLSDEGNASLVGFGEAASSTISGPTSRRMNAGARGSGSPTTLKQGSASPMQGVQEANPAMLDGVAHGQNNVDTTSRVGGDRVEDVSMTGREHAEAVTRERLDEGDRSRRILGSPEDDKGLGKFYFEGKQT